MTMYIFPVWIIVYEELSMEISKDWLDCVKIIQVQQRMEPRMQN